MNIVTIVLLLAAFAQVAVVDQSIGVAIPEGKLAFYIVDKRLTARVEPIRSAAVAAVIEPLELKSIKRATDQWFLLHWREADEPRFGWVEFDPDNLIADDPELTVFFKLVKLKKLTWPLSVKADVLRGKPRIGFTKEQVELALGAPTLKNEIQTAAGARESWLYSDRIVTFDAKGRVVVLSTTSK